MHGGESWDGLGDVVDSDETEVAAGRQEERPEKKMLQKQERMKKDSIGKDQKKHCHHHRRHRQFGRTHFDRVAATSVLSVLLLQPSDPSDDHAHQQRASPTQSSAKRNAR